MKHNFYKSILAVSVIFFSLFTASAQTAISTFEELAGIEADMQGEYYLTNDIEIPNGVNWKPIGYDEAVPNAPTPFQGTLDGRGHVIKNLTFFYDTGKMRGLFGALRHATIKDLGLENVNLKGTVQVGAIAGTFTGESVIERVWVTGVIEGDDTTGGLIGGIPIDEEYPGYNVVKDCYVNIDLKVNKFQGGGIVGQAGNKQSKLSVENVLVAGKLQGFNTTDPNNNMGGIFGYTASGAIQIKSVAIVCDEISGYTPNYIYCRAQDLELTENLHAKEITLVYANEANKGKGANLEINFHPEDEFKMASLYTGVLGWDFENVWTIEEGVSYPTLKGAGTSALDAIEADLDYNLYAANGNIVVSALDAVSVNIVDITGKVLYQDAVSAEKSFAVYPGLYIVQLRQGNKTIAQKVLVD